MRISGITQGFWRGFSVACVLAAMVAGCPPPAIVDTENPAGVAMTRSGDTLYVPGGAIDISVRIDAVFGDTVAALGLTETLPDGWAFVSASGSGGSAPSIAPPAGAAGDLTFAWIAIPTFPFTFTYTLMVPFNATGTADITGQVEYRQLAGPITTGPVVTSLAVANQAGVVFQRSSDTSYTAGATTTVGIVIDAEKGDTITAIGLAETIPAGWVFVSSGESSGDAPAIVPDSGKGGTLDFVWITPPAFPVAFTYTLMVPEGQAGTVEITGHVEYRQDAGPLGTGELVTTLGSGNR